MTDLGEYECSVERAVRAHDMDEAARTFAAREREWYTDGSTPMIFWVEPSQDGRLSAEAPRWMAAAFNGEDPGQPASAPSSVPVGEGPNIYLAGWSAHGIGETMGEAVRQMIGGVAEHSWSPCATMVFAVRAAGVPADRVTWYCVRECDMAILGRDDDGQCPHENLPETISVKWTYESTVEHHEDLKLADIATALSKVRGEPVSLREAYDIIHGADDRAELDEMLAELETSNYYTIEDRREVEEVNDADGQP